MLDKHAFMEILHSVQDIAKASAEPLTREEIRSYFQDMELTREQEDMVYQYLSAPQEEAVHNGSKDEELVGAEASGDRDENPDSGEEPGDRDEISDRGDEPGDRDENPDSGEEPCDRDENSDSRAIRKNDGTNIELKGKVGTDGGEKEPKKVKKRQNMGITSRFQMYLDEIERIRIVSGKEEQALYSRLFDGDENAVAAVSDQWLKRVTEIAVECAEEHAGEFMAVDDLVQEGNIGLLTGINQLLGKGDHPDAKEFLGGCIRAAMESCLAEEAGEGEQEKSILAKVSLVHEAQSLLAEHKGSKPSVQELSEYTRISPQEITDILCIVKESE